MPTLKRIAGNLLFFIGLVLIGAAVASVAGWAAGLSKDVTFLVGLFCGLPAGFLTASRISDQQHQDWIRGER